MTRIAHNYARALYELGIGEESIRKSERLAESSELMRALGSPVVSKKAKHRIVDKVFPKEMHNFVKLLCDYGSVCYIPQIFKAYDAYVDECHDVLTARLVCVVPPDDAQKEKMKEFIRKKFGKQHVKMEIVQDDSLIGGFILKVMDVEYDWSTRGRMERLASHLKRM